MIEIKGDDIKIIREPDNELNHGNDRGYYLEIYKWKKDDIEQIKQQILTNQKLIDDLLGLWLELLDHGIGGLPTKEEANIFEKISDIIPKELRDMKLNELRKEVKHEQM